MTINTGDKDLDNLLKEQLFKMASKDMPLGNLLSKAACIREAAFHDFSAYRFLVTPDYIRKPSPYPGAGSTVDGTNVGLGALMEFDKFVSLFQPGIDKSILEWFSKEKTRMPDFIRSTYDTSHMGPDYTYDFGALIRQYAMDGFRAGMAADLYVLFKTVKHGSYAGFGSAEIVPDSFMTNAVQAVGEWLKVSLFTLCGPDGLYDDKELLSVGQGVFWEKGTAEVIAKLKASLPAQADEVKEEPEFGTNLPDSYIFEPFTADTINFGLQIIYRQSWIPLGTQPGEIVRTLPLGPKQSEKISFKVVRRTKATRQAEISTSIETATESSAATKDSSEVVQEASEKFNWHVEASASASWGFGSAEVKAGAGGENSAASKNMKSQLNETMEKTASKIRKDTKIIVSTEVETTSEMTQASEITNPNDEIAVTYIYSRLQRQYELRTYLSEVNQVVFVAEQIPAPNEITGPWIRRYDWIIAKELLDDSFRSDLDTVRGYHQEKSELDELDPRITGLMETISGDISKAKPPTGIPDYKSLGGQIPDLFQNQQAAYERELERKRVRETNREQYERSLNRLRAHIYDNILYYCRAIWSSEDPDARILRYQQIRVPIRWELCAESAGPLTLQGYFVPSVINYERDTVPLSEMVNPAGPIGFAGNYAVFYLNQSIRWSSLLKMIGIIQMPYLVINPEIERGAISPAITLRASVSDNTMGLSRLRCTYGIDQNGLPKLTVDEWRSKTWVYICDVPIKDNAAVEFPPADPSDPFAPPPPQIRLWVSGLAAFQNGDSFEIALTTQQSLEDPELKALRWSIPPLEDKEDKEEFYSQSVIAEMREYFTDVFLAFQQNESDVSWNKCSDKQQELLVKRYYDYLLRKRHTRRIMLDTNNLLLTREVDGATSLEPFKGLHRVIDVLKANEEFNKSRLENERRRARLDANKLGDPDVEKLTVVASVPGAAELAALDGLEEDPDGSKNPVEEG